MYRPGDHRRRQTPENLLAVRTPEEKWVNTGIFDTLGVGLIREARQGGIVVLDELGFIERDAAEFQKAVLSLLDGEIPVIAAVKNGHEDVKFLNSIKNHKNITLYNITEENRDSLYETLLPIITDNLTA